MSNPPQTIGPPQQVNILRRAAKREKKRSQRKNVYNEKRNVVLYVHAQQPHRFIYAARDKHEWFSVPIPEQSALDRSNDRDLNWTEAILRECYGPIAGKSPEKSMYRHFAFNFMPVLWAQLSAFAPDLLRDIVAADRLSMEDNNGHGNANAAPMDHTILPLASPLDRSIQIDWGIKHFEHHFGRKSEGLWLPECGADEASLADVANAGIKYVVLSPKQVKRIKLGASWRNIHYDSHGFPILDFGRPYKINVRGEELFVFLYNPYFSQKFSMEQGWLEGCQPSDIANEINYQLGNFDLCALGTDVETIGHHKKGTVPKMGELIRLGVRDPFNFRFTNFGDLLEQAQRNPEAIKAIEIHDPSAWSCAHGVGRWTDNCGCEGDNPWRWPLREAIDYLAEQEDALFLKRSGILNDPEGAKRRYINVLLGQQTFEGFLSEEIPSKKHLSERKRRELSILFNSLPSRQAMFVSCGWFFCGMGLETEIALGLAGDSIRILRTLRPDLEFEFLGRLAQIDNSPGAREENKPANAALAYYNAVKNQRNWYKKFMRSQSV